MTTTNDALDAAIGAALSRLAALGNALRAHDGAAIESQAGELHRALARAVDGCARAKGGVPPALRERLASAGARVAAEREALARATAALDRAIDILLPAPTRQGASLYDARGGAHRATPSGGSVSA